MFETSARYLTASSCGEDTSSVPVEVQTKRPSQKEIGDIEQNVVGRLHPFQDHQRKRKQKTLV